jgi:diacylglycerol kinase
MKRLIKSFGYAFDGLRSALKTERNLRIHIVAMFLAVILGLYLGLSTIEWGFIIFAIGFVLFAELINTAMERLGDEAANGRHKQTVKKAKDTAAAAVMLSALTALVIGVLFLFIPLFNKLSNL